MGFPILCWTDPDPTEDWEPSPENVYWHPRGPRYPDTRKLKPGDIILFKPAKPTLSQKLIREFQKGNPFTHAALYLGNDWVICEATPKLGVAHSDLETKLKTACILVRRVPDIDDDSRGRMARAAADLRGHPYAFRQIFEKALQRFRKISATELEGAGVVCSTLCEHAILEGTLGRTQIRKFSNQVVSPADLAESEALIDVAMEWRKNPRAVGIQPQRRSKRAAK